MKKAKVILTALTAFAIVGGALAFKAEKLNGTLFCTTSQGARCDISTTYRPTTDNTNGVQIFCADKVNGANGCVGQTQTQLVITND